MADMGPCLRRDDEDGGWRITADRKHKKNRNEGDERQVPTTMQGIEA